MTQLKNAPTSATETPATLTPAEVSAPTAPKRPWLWWLIGSIAVTGIGVGIWYAFFRPQPKNFIPFSGRIEGYETDVSTKGAGRIETITVREGETVTKGQLLVLLDDAEVQSELAAANSQLEAAKQRSAAARLAIVAIENQVTDAGLNLQQSEGDTSGKVAEADALVATAQAALQQSEAQVEEVKALREQARVDRDRFSSLAISGAETQQRADLAQTAFKAAEAAVRSREAAVEVTRSAIAIAQGKSTQAQTTSLNPDRQATNVSRLQAQVNQAKVALLGAQADVKTAEANRKLIQSRLNNLTVKSPIAGVVTTRGVEPGTVVLPSRPLLRIVDLSQVYMRGFIPGGQITQIRVGQATRIYLDNDPQHQRPLNATVTAIDAKASFTPENVYFQKDRVEQVFGVKLKLDQPNSMVKPGMPVDAEVSLRQ